MFLAESDGEIKQKFLSLKHFTSLGTPIYFHKQKTLNLATIINEKKVGNSLKDFCEQPKR